MCAEKWLKSMIYYYYFFVDKSYFRLTDLKIDTLTLKMPFNHENSSKNELFVKNNIEKMYYTFPISVC